MGDSAGFSFLVKKSASCHPDLQRCSPVQYEMLTGRTPFTSTDPIKIIHSHIAKEPPVPSGTKRFVPEVLSDIAMKLLTKIPDDRYQSSAGLIHGCTQVLTLLRAGKWPVEFSLAEKDVPVQFSIPQKLYGRETELSRIKEGLARVLEGGTEILIITGPPGIGKSALIHEMNKMVAAKNGHFLTGKYERLERDIPYSTLTDALRDRVNQVLGQSKDDIALWKQRLLHSVGKNILLLIELLPELEFIIGEQGPLPDISLEDMDNRFRLAFRNFVSLFATAEPPPRSLP